MLLDKMFGHTKLPLLEKSLKAATMRQKVRANNIANVHTPGYKALDVRFESKLRRALNNRMIAPVTPHEKHIELADNGRMDAEIFMAKDNPNNTGLNNVDIEYEMAQLVKNQLNYMAATRFTMGTFNKLKSAIKGRSA